MRKVFAFLAIALWYSLISLKVQALEKQEAELSNPYIELSADKLEVEPQDELGFAIIFGNLGPEASENIRITLNQPLDGRSPLQFVDSDPKPDDWITSEYGNLAVFKIPYLDTFEATEEGEIAVETKVRESAAPQTFSVTANLEAPKRPVGERLVASQDLEIKINSSGQLDNLETTDEEFSAGVAAESVDISEPDSEGDSEAHQEPTLREKLLSSEALGTTLVFLLASSFLIIAFLAGRKSQKH